MKRYSFSRYHFDPDMHIPREAKIHLTIIALATLLILACWILLLQAEPVETDAQAIEPLDEKVCSASDVVCPGESLILAETPSDAPELPVLHVTGFSSVECHTTWCNAHRGLPRGSQVALNAKYHASKVYLPEYDRTYDVIGTTDQHTDLDIWFGDNQQEALKFGSQYLQVELIP